MLRVRAGLGVGVRAGLGLGVGSLSQLSVYICQTRNQHSHDATGAAILFFLSRISVSWMDAFLGLASVKRTSQG